MFFYRLLHKNELTGNIPDELSKLTNLTKLYENLFLFLSHYINNYHSNLYSNNLSGEIPKDLSMLTNLTHL